MAYSISPDAERPSHLDPEAGGDNSPVSKRSGYRPVDEFDDRARDRSGARDLDRMVEAGDFTRARKDLERAFPRPAVTRVNERKRRALPIPDAIRLPPSSRQRKARSVAKNAAQDQLPTIGYKAVVSLVSEKATWMTVGSALTAARGDAQGLDERTRSQVQRIDRAIQAAERGNDRGHVVYCAVSVPHSLPEQPANLPRALQPGSRIEFDRFTMATHAIHELDPVVGDREVIFEMETARGMYLGGSDSVDDTSHLLPRGDALAGRQLARRPLPAPRRVVRPAPHHPTTRPHRGELMPYIDAKGRPEILVHPDIKLGLANYRPADKPEDPPVQLTEKEKKRIAARQAAKKAAVKRKQRTGTGAEQQKTGGTPDKG